jgi:microcystin degradation protein MlrC
MWRIGVGKLWSESNSFSSLNTTLGGFETWGLFSGSEVIESSDRRDEITGFINVLGADADVEIVPLANASALPSGIVEKRAADEIEARFQSALDVAGQLDGVCLALHGAVSAESDPDLDGRILEIVRGRLGNDIPIVTALDCHAIVTQRMIELSTALIGYRTHPHVDLVETGERAAEIVLDVLRGRTRPTVHSIKVPMILPPPDDGTNSGPLKELFDKFIAYDEEPDVIACSLCPSFAWQDVEEQGWTALAVTDGNPELAGRLAADLAREAWRLRFDLQPEPMVPPDDAVRQAAEIEGCPVVITDSADTVGGGAPGDSTAIIESLLKLRGEVDGLILIHLPDPDCVAAARSAGVGAIIKTTVGGKRDRRFSSPAPVEATVLAIEEGPIHDDGKFTSEEMIEVGGIASLGVDNVRFVVTDRPILGPQPSVFRKVGLEPFEAKIVALKTGVGYKVTYEHVAKAVIHADCPGAVSYNMNNLDFRRIDRPMFPLDREFDWSPGA